MQKKYIVLFMILLLPAAVLAAGCPRREPPAEPGPQEITETVTFYYGDEGNEQLVSEEREVVYPEGYDRFQAVLETLIAGPRTEGYTANIPSGTRVYGTILQNDALIVNVSEEFATFGGSVAETVALASLTTTLGQFEEIERVKILVEGEELIGPSGQPRGFMAPFDAQESPSVSVETAILYFARPDATAVVPEERKIAFPPEAGIEEQLQIVLEELIDGPERTDLARTIPENVRVLSLRVEENVATVDFSREMHTEHTGGAAGESMTILSIVNTMTEFRGIELVMMKVAGEPMNIEHVILDAPVERNEALIEED
ncbi:MAG: GerMN domain-containing protein [Bacillota bacterium]|nr:GerMN domain-containing protein [Bacillota bacterium]MDW7683690.1 GerMN domain-containing protein [Bacillota bacterium]